jgi:hypothetical protein
MRLAKAIVLAAALAAAPLMLASGADAGKAGRSGSVTACSHYARGCVTGATRRGRHQAQVRMPGGTWIDCKGDCRQTLREESVDFFDTLRDRVMDR